MNKANWKIKTGIALMILSGIIFAGLLAVPFLEAEGRVKITITTIIIIAGEVTFWTGGILVGKEIFNRYKPYFNPLNWFRKKEI